MKSRAARSGESRQAVEEAVAASAAALTALIGDCAALTLAALQDGKISWTHARIIVEETATLDRAGAAGLEAHCLDDPGRSAVPEDLLLL